MSAVKRRWIIAGVAAWALVIAGLALYSYRNDPPTARDQTTIADALPTLDEALGHVYAALDPATSVAALGGYTRTDSSCKVTTAREGTRSPRPAGGGLWTVEAVVSGAGDGAAARATVPASALVLDDPKVFAYRAGAAGVALRTRGDSLVISSSAGC